MIDGYQSMKVMNLNFTESSVDLSEFAAKKKKKTHLLYLILLII